jgi:ATP-binding cassette subfamily B protein
LIGLLKILKNYLPKKYLIFFLFALLILLITAFAEMISISSVFPFLTSLQQGENANSALIGDLPLLNIFFKSENTKALSLFNSVLFLSISATIAASLRLLSYWINELFAAKFGSYLSKLLFKYSIEKDYEYFASDNTNKIIVGLTQHIDGTVRALSFLLQFLTGIAIALSIIIFLILLNPQATLLSLFIFIFAYIILGLLFKSKLISNSKYVAAASQQKIKIVRETIGGIRDIFLEGKSSFAIIEFSKKDYKIRLRQAINRFISIFPRYSLEAIGIITLAFVSLYLRDDQNKVDIATLGVIAFGAQRLLPALQSLYASWAMLKNFSADIFFVLNSLKDRPLTTNYENREIKTFKNFKTLNFDNVSFSYKSQKNEVLKKFSIKFHKGEKIGIIGKTGSGKSTFIDLLLGLLKPSNGSILINNEYKLNQFNNSITSSWRKCLSLVPQDVYLRNETLLENIYDIGNTKKDIISGKIKKATESALLDEFIPRLEKGIYSTVGERGLKLSGGQKQRVGIARALAKEKPILILDESTSALDKKTELRILNNIKENYPELTIFMITHREENLNYCDRVIKIEEGRIFEI